MMHFTHTDQQWITRNTDTRYKIDYKHEACMKEYGQEKSVENASSRDHTMRYLLYIKKFGGKKKSSYPFRNILNDKFWMTFQKIGNKTVPRSHSNAFRLHTIWVRQRKDSEQPLLDSGLFKPNAYPKTKQAGKSQYLWHSHQNNLINFHTQGVSPKPNFTMWISY